MNLQNNDERLRLDNCHDCCGLRPIGELMPAVLARHGIGSELLRNSAEQIRPNGAIAMMRFEESLAPAWDMTQLLATA